MVVTGLVSDHIKVIAACLIVGGYLGIKSGMLAVISFDSRLAFLFRNSINYVFCHVSLIHELAS